MMKVAFVSNFYNHHQEPVSFSLYEKLNGQYAFISTNKISQERIQMGWGKNEEPNFVKHYEDNPNECDKIINEYDVVIIGSAPYNIIKTRLQSGKLTFLYHERLFKEKPNWIKMIKYKLQYYQMFGRYKNFYLLCASGFSYYDFKRVNSFKNRAFKWGYFPKTIAYENLMRIIENKERDFASILFVSRMIQWKHPELPVLVAKKLKEDGIKFKMTLVGNGVLTKDIIEMINSYNLKDEIVMLDNLTPDQVRDHMINSNIFLFTSDRNEGWGAVLNEAMNSCCAVVTSSAIGSTPYLVRNCENGFIYKDGDFDDLYDKTKQLCINKELRKKYSVEAYKTIFNSWNADIASKRFIDLSQNLLNNENEIICSDGPCSKANLIKDNWFKTNDFTR